MGPKQTNAQTPNSPGENQMESLRRDAVQPTAPASAPGTTQATASANRPSATPASTSSSGVGTPLRKPSIWRNRHALVFIILFFLTGILGLFAWRLYSSISRSTSQQDVLKNYSQTKLENVNTTSPNAASSIGDQTVSINGELAIRGGIQLSEAAIDAISRSLTNKVNLSTNVPQVAQAGNINIGGTIIASTFQGNGANLSNINAAAITSGTLSNDRLDSTVTRLGQVIPLSALSGGVLGSLNGISSTTGTGAVSLVAGTGIQITPNTGTSEITITSTNSGGDITSVVAGTGLTGGGTSGDVTINLDSTVTIQGNTFNGAGQLVQLDGTGALPAISGSNITALNASALSTGTINNTRLSSDVTLQGNTFNVANKLVQLDGTGALPVVSGSNLTNLNASQITSGTLGDSRLSANVTLQGNTFNVANKLVQLTGSGALPTLSGVNLTSLNASNIAAGTLSDSRLSANVALLNGNQTFSGNNTFSSPLTVNTIQPTATMTIGATNQSLILQGDMTAQFRAVNGSDTVAIGFTGTPTGNLTYNFDAATTPGTYTVCTTVGNCASSGGGVTTLGGTTNKLTKFTGSQSVGDSSISDNGSLVTVVAQGLYKASADSTTAFQVQNAAGSSNVFTVDTTNTRVGVGVSTPSYSLDVAGDINSTTGLRVGGNLVCDSTGCTAGSNSGFYVQNGTALQTAANFNIESSSTSSPTGILKAKSGQTADILQAKNAAGTVIAKIDVSGNLDIAGQYRIGGSQISSSNLSDVSSLAKLSATQAFTGVNTFQNAVDSSSAFVIQNAAGTSNLFVADTSNSRLGIGTNTPGYMLDVNGDINIGSGSNYRINGVAICGGAGTCAPSAGSSSYIQNSTSVQTSANFAIQSTSSGSVAGILRGAASQTANIFEVQTSTPSTVFAVGATGQILSKNSTDSTTAFQIQNAAASPILVADTTNTRIAIGQSSANYALDVSGDINASTTLKVGGNTVCTSTGCAVAPGSTAFIQNGTSTQTGNFNVQSGSASNVTGVISATTSQTADILQLKDSNGSVVLSANPSTPNLISNPSFDTNTTGWAAYGSGVISRVTSQQAYGPASLQISSTGIGDGAKFPYALVSGTAYTFSIYYKSSTASTAMDIGYSVDGTTITNCSTYSAYSSLIWQRITCNFTPTGTTGSAFVFVRATTAGTKTYFVDAAQLELTVGGVGSAYQQGTIALNGVVSSPVTIRNTANSVNVFDIQNSAGQSFFTFDTSSTSTNAGTLKMPYTGSIVYGSLGSYHGEITGSGLGDLTVLGNGAVFLKTNFNSATALQVQNVSSNVILNVDSSTTGNANLITNPSFDTATTGYTATTGATLTRTTSDQFSGAGALSVVTTATSNAGARYTYTLAANTTYSFSLYAKAVSSSFSTFEIGYTNDGSTSTSCATGQTVITGAWTRYTCTFTVSASPTGTRFVYFRQTDATARTFYIDAVQLEAASASTNYSLGAVSLNGVINSAATFKNQSDSTTAFQVQNAAGTNQFSINTSTNVTTVAGSQFIVKNASDSTTEMTIQNASGTAFFTADSTNMKITVKDLAITGHIISGGSAPSIAANTGAGTSPTISISGTDTAGTITLTTGSSPATSADVLTVTFAAAFSAAPQVVFSPANGNAATLSGNAAVYVTPATGTFKLSTGSSGLTGSTQYKWTYHVIQ